MEPMHDFSSTVIWQKWHLLQPFGTTGFEPAVVLYGKLSGQSMEHKWNTWGELEGSKSAQPTKCGLNAVKQEGNHNISDFLFSMG